MHAPPPCDVELREIRPSQYTVDMVHVYTAMLVQDEKLESTLGTLLLCIDLCACCLNIELFTVSAYIHVYNMFVWLVYPSTCSCFRRCVCVCAFVDLCVLFALEFSIRPTLHK